jgi:hypothetical protein
MGQLQEITDGRTEGGAAGRVDNAYVGLTLIPVIDRLQVHWLVSARPAIAPATQTGTVGHRTLAVGRDVSG